MSGRDILYAFFFETDLGRIGVGESRGSITSLWFEGYEVPADVEAKKTGLLEEARRQLSAYLAGELEEFSLPVDPRGTPFQLKVWDELRHIPYGSTASYKDIAAAVGNPLAARAVGSACNRNPIPIVIPCHRVVGADGRLVGYAGGLELKEKLLLLEKRTASGIHRA